MKSVNRQVIDQKSVVWGKSSDVCSSDLSGIKSRFKSGIKSIIKSGIKSGIKSVRISYEAG